MESQGKAGTGPAAGNLPRRLSSLVGRERELAEIAAELRRTRLLTLSGAGGVGKTTLALEAAARAEGEYPDGAFWVELASVTSPDDVARAFALGLGVRPLPGRSELDAAIAYLAPRRALVVLDNCEHLLEPCARIAEALLRACGELTLIATSRAPLAVPGESEWRVPSLSLPGAAADEDPRDSEAVALFVERARKVRAGFELTGGNTGAVAEICGRLDGMPLAIELAAARLRLLSPQQIAAGLGDALGIVGGGPRTAEPRQRTLRASIEWSHDLLPEPQQRLLRRLAVFVGGFTVPLAEAVCAGEDASGAAFLDLLGGLVEHSLVQLEGDGGMPRYRLLETVRQFGVERLEAAGEHDLLRDRHRDAMLDLAERHWAIVVTPRQPEALALVDAEGPNLIAAINWALETDVEVAQRLCQRLLAWFIHRGRVREANAATEAALAAAGPGLSALRARTLAAHANTLGHGGEFDRAEAVAQEALAMAEETGDPEALALARLEIANALLFHDPARAPDAIRELRALGELAGHEPLVARAAMLRAMLAWFAFEPERFGALDEDLDLIRRAGDRDTLCLAHVAIAGSAWSRLDEDTCREHCERAIEASREVGGVLGEYVARMLLALLDLARGRASAALDSIRAVEAGLRAQGVEYLLAWVETAHATALAAAGELAPARERLESVLDGEFGRSPVHLAWARCEYLEVLRLLGDGEACEREAAIALQPSADYDSAWLAARAQTELGRRAAARGEWTEAERLHHEALATVIDRQIATDLPAVLEGLAEVAAGLGSHVEAARLLGAAGRIRRERGPAAWPAQREEMGALTARVRDAVGARLFEDAAAEGVALPDDRLLGWIRRARGERKRPPRGWESLTPTELEVARHVAEGLTNPEIGTRMFVSRSTVKTHLAHIYAKLGIANRVELAREAERRAG